MNNFLRTTLFINILTVLSCAGMDKAILPLFPSISKANDGDFNRILNGMQNIKLNKDTRAILKNFATYHKQSLIYQEQNSPQSILDDPTSNLYIKEILGLTVFGVATLGLVYASTYPEILSRKHMILYPATFLSGYVCIEGLKKIFCRDNLNNQIASLEVIEKTLDNYNVQD